MNANETAAAQAKDADLLRLCAEIWAMMEKATPGPWGVDPDERHDGAAQVVYVSKSGMEYTLCFMSIGRGQVPDDDNDANLIASLRNAAPLLLSAAESSVRMRELLKLISADYPHISRRLMNEIAKELGHD